MLDELTKYVLDHTTRGACTCGKCVDAVPDPKADQPKGHTADMIFFKVCLRDNPDPVTFVRLVTENRAGAFNDVDPFDGKEHGYIELGGWIGDQGLALQFMAMGALLGVWKLLTPRTILGDSIPEDMAQSMAGQGYVTIQSEKSGAVAAA